MLLYKNVLNEWQKRSMYLNLQLMHMAGILQCAYVNNLNQKHTSVKSFIAV